MITIVINVLGRKLSICIVRSVKTLWLGDRKMMNIFIGFMCALLGAILGHAYTTYCLQVDLFGKFENLTQKEIVDRLNNKPLS